MGDMARAGKQQKDKFRKTWYTQAMQAVDSETQDG